MNSGSTVSRRGLREHKHERLSRNGQAAAKRYAYRLNHLTLEIEHPGGGFTQRDVTASSLSTDDITLVHRGFLHVGSHLQLVLPTVDGDEKISLTGILGSCNHLENDAHESNMVFDAKIDPRHFIELAGNFEDDAEENLLDLAGSVLIYDDDEAVCKLIQYMLSGTRVDVVTALDIDAALTQLKRRDYDLLLVDLGEDGGKLNSDLQCIQQQGYRNTILGMSSIPERIHETVASSVATTQTISRCLRKPFAKAELRALLFEVFQSQSGQRVAQPIRSALRGDREMADMLEWYQYQVRRMMNELELAFNKSQADRVASICRGLTETAGGYGYAPILELAQELADKAEAIDDLSKCSAMVRQLSDYCGRME